MKHKPIHSILLILCVSMLAISGCKKIPGDFRNEYWGTYFFTYDCYLLDNGGQIGPKVHTGGCEGKIYYEKKAATNSLIIEMNDNSIQLNGFFFEGNMGFSLCDEIGSGYFIDKENLLFTLSPACAVGLYEADAYAVYGVRKQ